MKPLLKAGEHIEGMHWVAEYRPLTHDIRVLRENVEVGTYCAPPTLFGDEAEIGAASHIDHRSQEAALRAYLRNFVKEHDAEE
ncbi:hypothetical protein QZM46_03045 [Burkholderia vietnamiensis]|jgi:hypothetical protein|uniref:Uncharacterized protein n=2 Tax=Burkholderia vietnamiensis TaxID=60552 RepID=A4JKB7_BURVG|nr:MULTISPECIES: hypothetical protein [Burkholderia]ABO56720.1 conserved hypothetical protein [Burkholderia vietnamiensis G4]AFJ87754.1 hypothetical protein MYA_3395 [Burkholderia sp. KJ006]AJY03410.1 hypothetical protein AK36_4969 [Burkholderia vietnamiensis LMG 10929]AOJ99389.1 hypothetical protein WK23_12565 [Burkholderia vietnamiensis]AOK11711.1 hypothetical protein WK31_15275 [Burkholderia vietnamiensis]